MALFSGSAADAMKASISMLKRLADYNSRRACKGYSPIDIGIGVNTGQLVLVTVGGCNRIVSVYEVFEADPAKTRDLKLASKTDFETALLYYCQQDFQTAAAGFGQRLNDNPADTVARIYLGLCQR